MDNRNLKHVKWPKDFSKNELVYTIDFLLRYFCEINHIKYPKIIVDNFKCTTYGWFESRSPENIYCNIRRCRPTTQHPGHSWSFPGFKADLTTLGVIAHEFGHYLSFHKFKKDKHVAKAIYEVMMSGEPGICSYDSETDPHETVAESIRLFITNPDLLRCGRPNHWLLITEIMKLKPVIDTPWREVLSNAHPKFISVAEKWIEEGYKTTRQRNMRKNCLPKTLW